MSHKLHLALATGLFSGYLRPFPGTWGSGAAVIVWFLLGTIFPPVPLVLDICGIVLITFLGIHSTNRVLQAIESGAIPTPRRPKDPNMVVIDEWAGMWITLLGTARSDYIGIVICFILFRLLDIIKPPPVRQLERLPTGLGIMLDDVAAGIIGLIAIYLLRSYSLIPTLI